MLSHYPRALLQKGIFMLYKLRTKAELYSLSNLPRDILPELENITGTLDACYNRFGYDGGYALVAENITDLQEVKANYLDYTTEPPEVIREINGFMSVLYLPATEYSVSLIFPESLTKEVIR